MSKISELEERIWKRNLEVGDLLKGEIPTPWLPGCPSVTISRDHVWNVAQYPTKGASAREIIMRDAEGNYSWTPIEKFNEPPGASAQQHRQRIQLIKNQKFFWEITPRLDELERLRKERDEARIEESFFHTESYNVVKLNGQSFSLTKQQAGIIRYLHVQRELCPPGQVSVSSVMEYVDSPSSNLKDTFRSNKAAKSALITSSGCKKGCIRLNL